MKNLIKSCFSIKTISFALILGCHYMFLFGPLSVLSKAQTNARLSYSKLDSDTVRVQFAYEIKESKEVKKQEDKSKKKTTQKIKEKVAKKSRKSISHEKVSTGQNSTLAKYTSEVKEILEKNKFYPLLAKRMGHKGLVKANFVILKDGKVEKIVTIDSEYKTLSNAVKELILEKSTFPKFPDELGKQALSIVVPINFEI